MTEEKKDEAAAKLSQVCGALLSSIDKTSKKKSISIIKDGIEWLLNNLEKITSNLEFGGGAAPNLIGFQMALKGMARWLRLAKKNASKVIIDLQDEFNLHQQNLADLFLEISKHGLDKYGYELPDFNLKKVPAVPFEIKSSERSPGLQLVDLFLWLFKRASEFKEIPLEAVPLLNHRGYREVVSINGIANILKDCLKNKTSFTEAEKKDIEAMLALQEKIKSSELCFVGSNCPRSVPFR